MLCDKVEIKIFLSTFVIYLLFLNWVGWAENSLYDLTRAIVDENRLEIDSFYNNTGDRLLINGHYYSNKAPGGAMLAAIPYAIWKPACYEIFIPKNTKTAELSGLFIEEWADEKIYSAFNLDFCEKTSMILVTALTSTLMTALTVILVYRISKYATMYKPHRLIIAFAYGFGTLAFHYATKFVVNSTGTFFAFAAFYLLFEMKHRKHTNKKLPALAGILAGFSIVTNYWNVLFTALYAAQIVSLRNKDFIKIFSLCFLAGISPLLIYNYIIAENPLEPLLAHSDTKIWIAPSSTMGFKFELGNLVYLIPQLLIFPFRGLIFYSPLILLSFIGMFYMYKKYKLETIVILITFILFLAVNSLERTWWAGQSFGPRYLMPIIPFMIFAVAFATKKFGTKIILVFLFISILFNLASFSTPKNIVTHIIDREYAYNYYLEQAKNFSIIGNPIFDYYLPEMLRHGPESRIITSLMGNREKLDIRYLPASTYGFTENRLIYLLTMTPYGFINLKTDFLTIPLMAFLIAFIWKNEILRFTKKRNIKLNYMTKSAMMIFLAVIFLILFIKITAIRYDNNWHEEENYAYGKYRWMSQNATVNVYNKDNTSYIVRFNAWSYSKPRTLKIFLNENEIMSRNIFGLENMYVITNMTAGSNLLTLSSIDGCESPRDTEHKYDFRCLSFGVSEIKIWNLNNMDKKTTYLNGWFNKEQQNKTTWRWMTYNSTMIVFSNYTAERNISMIIYSYYKNRTLSVTTNGNTLKFGIPTDRINVSITVPLTFGTNQIEFTSIEGCDYPSENEGSADDRCLSFALDDLEIK